MKAILASLAALLLVQSAMADQCAYNSRATAQAARAILVEQDFIYSYCELCGDTGPTEYPVYSDSEGTKDGKAIHFRSRGNKYWEFAINEDATDGARADLDLAYTYIYMGGSLVNVGHMLRCNRSGEVQASEIIKFEASKVKCPTGACG